MMLTTPGAAGRLAAGAAGAVAGDPEGGAGSLPPQAMVSRARAAAAATPGEHEDLRSVMQKF
jgi:hypothetical protein